jgi:hypothetical protein
MKKAPIAVWPYERIGGITEDVLIPPDQWGHRLTELFVCLGCGAAVANREDHDKWHRGLEDRSSSGE